VRIAFFHNWSWLGSAVGRSLIEEKRDDLWVIGAPVPMAERDPELRMVAKRAGSVLAAPRDVGSPRFVERLKRFAPELILVATFARKLPPSVLGLAEVAAINVHASLLPKYRGALPEFWVLRNGEAETGVSLHLMTAEFDAGRVLAQVSLPVLGDDDLLTLSQRIAGAGAPLVLELLERYRKGERPAGIEQDLSKVTRAPMPKEEDLQIRWNEPCCSIERLVRAASPVLEPYTNLRGERLIVRLVRPAPYFQSGLAPGELMFDSEHRLIFAGAGDGPVALEEVELIDGIRLRGPSLAKIFGIRAGERVRLE
jgi:methionyl-tRNA formyltransferase